MIKYWVFNDFSTRTHKTYVKHLNFKLYYQQLHLTYLWNLAKYWLQTAWEWHGSVETCSSLIICEIIVHLLITVQNDNRCKVHGIKIINIWVFFKEICREYSSFIKFGHELSVLRIKTCIPFLSRREITQQK